MSQSMISVYTQEWDGELTDLDVETKELGLSIRLMCQRCLKNGSTVEKYLAWKEAGIPTLLIPQHNNGMQRTLENVSQLEM